MDEDLLKSGPTRGQDSVEAQYQVMFADFYGDLRRFIGLLCGRDHGAAQEVEQRTYVAGQEYFRGLDDHSKFGNWLRVIARNKFRDIKKEEKRAREQVVGGSIEFVDFSSDPAEMIASTRQSPLVPLNWSGSPREARAN